MASMETDTAEPDLNGNSPDFGAIRHRTSLYKDHVTTSDGRVFYPCRFCNKVFPIRKSRTAHVRQCPAKEYILSVGEAQALGLPPPKKIDIQQNIVLNKAQPEEKKSPPIKLTIRRSIINGSKLAHHFTVSNNSLILKEKNNEDEFASIAKRLESNSVTIVKQSKEVEVAEARPTAVVVVETQEANIENGGEGKLDTGTDSEASCRECTKELDSPMELLRHARKCHSYPKVVMALSEVKKFYSTEDRSECPICRKPLKTTCRSAFVKHLHTHTNEMKYRCHVCNRKFRRSDHMKAHEKRHIIEIRNEK